MKQLCIAVLTCAAVLPALAGAEDMTIVSKVTVNQGAPTTQTQYIGAQKLRTTDGETDTIVDAAAINYTVINHKKKEYYQFTRDELLAAMAKFEEQMAGPMAAVMEKMMGGPVGEVTLKKGAARKIAGYDCVTYTVALGENMRYELCAAEALVIPAAYYDTLKGSYALMGPMGHRFLKVFEQMKRIPGMPLAFSGNVNVMSIKMRIDSEATEVKRGPIPESVFAVPAGYKKKDSPFKG